MPLDCDGCARRREAIIAFGKRMADWVKRPATPPPEIESVVPQPTTAQAEALARIREIDVKIKS